MDWSKSYAVEYRVRRVNEETWGSTGNPVPCSGISIQRSCDGSVPLLESATMTVAGDFERGWYRIDALVEQDGPQKFALGTFLFESDSEQSSHGTVVHSLRGKSVLKPADDMLVPIGTYAPAGSNGAAYAANLLRQCTPAPVSVSGAFELSDNVVFNVGDSYLACVWKVLDAGGFVMVLDGEGNILIEPPEQVTVAVFDFEYGAFLMDGVKRELDAGGVPNRYYAIKGDQVGIATNEDMDSSVSFPRRRRWVDVIDTSPTRVNGETMAQYAQRRLEESSVVTRKITYSREYDPDARPYSLIDGRRPDILMEGTMSIVSQTVQCGAGIVLQETAYQRVRL